MKFPRKALSFIAIILLSVPGTFAAPAQKNQPEPQPKTQPQPEPKNQPESKNHPAPTKKKKAAATAPERFNFAPVDALVQQQVVDQSITGAVLMVGHGGRIVHQKAFGFRATT